MNVEEEVGRLKEEIHRLGQQQPDGSYKVPFPCSKLSPPASGAAADLSHPRRRISFSCAVLPSPGWPAPEFLPFSRCLVCNVQYDLHRPVSSMKLRWAIESRSRCRLDGL